MAGLSGWVSRLESRLTICSACCCASLLRDSGQAAVHVHDVGVGAVADLPAALPSHGDHQHVGLERLGRRDDGFRHAQGAEDRGPVGVGQRCAHLVLVQQSGAVRDRNPQDLAATDQPDETHRTFRLSVAGHLGHDLKPLRFEGQRDKVLVRAEPGHRFG